MARFVQQLNQGEWNREPAYPSGTCRNVRLSLTLTGCELVEGIFKAGFWIGVFGVVAVAVLVFLGLKFLRR